MAGIFLICNHELYCNEEEEEGGGGLDKLEEENTMLINIVLENDWCRKNLSEEYLKSYINEKKGLISQYFKLIISYRMILVA